MDHFNVTWEFLWGTFTGVAAVLLVQTVLKAIQGVIKKWLS